MHLIRASNGRVLARSENDLAPAVSGRGVDPPVISSTVPGEQALPAEELPVTLEEFEAEAHADSGIPEEAELGDIYVEDEEAASQRSDGKPGRKLRGGKRLKAYPPDRSTPVEKLRAERKRGSNQAVTWEEMEEVARRLRD